MIRIDIIHNIGFNFNKLGKYGFVSMSINWKIYILHIPKKTIFFTASLIQPINLESILVLQINRLIQILNSIQTTSRQTEMRRKWFQLFQRLKALRLQAQLGVWYPKPYKHNSEHWKQETNRRITLKGNLWRSRHRILPQILSHQKAVDERESWKLIISLKIPAL